LATYGIRSWYDRSSDSPLIYLGYPLSSTPRQRDHFFTAILQKVEKACQLQSQRILSVRGRATALNVLILSTLWHVLRVCPVPNSFMDRLRCLSHGFLTKGMSPRVSY
ncbi:uncharacterized protein BYT42DRAFT_475467, partial [Radiomyces spectabilis]|uniref:uncharacterized protein n=1 Tax=Radiomyces spectabilis TaxID=64574 RepID=UPI00221E74EB